MVGCRGLGAKVATGTNEAIAKEGAPGTVHRDTVPNRVIRTGQPAGKFQAVGGHLGVFTQKNLWNFWVNLMFGAGVFSSVAQVSGAGVVCRALLHDEGPAAVGKLFAQGMNLRKFVRFQRDVFPRGIACLSGNSRFLTITDTLGLPIITFRFLFRIFPRFIGYMGLSFTLGRNDFQLSN